ncbi:MAG: hypothetical protein CFK52_13585 [Chloracidobacterium sp. CP2_5A]|nr:MAG: hypothetical protein CFK52_13585 [Chloracidobacterium sp. CP2_5A]
MDERHGGRKVGERIQRAHLDVKGLAAGRRSPLPPATLSSCLSPRASRRPANASDHGNACRHKLDPSLDRRQLVAGLRVARPGGVERAQAGVI